MATYIELYDMGLDEDFRKQVTVACNKAAFDVTNEAANAPDHDARLQWAVAIQSATAPGLVTRMISACMQNATLQAEAPDGPWPDGDIQFVVNSNVTAQALG